MLVSSIIAVVAVVVTVAAGVWLYRRRRRGAAPQAYLYRREGKRVVRHGLRGKVTRIGRHPDNEIQVKNHSVSRFHAQIVDNENGTFLIRDLDSRNGVKIYYRRVSSSVLADGDVIYVGNVGMRFVHYPADYNMLEDTVQLDSAKFHHMTSRQRRVERFQSGRPVHFYLDGMGWMAGVTRDISEEGVFIETHHKLPRRAPLEIVVQRDGEERWLKIKGEVVRREPNGIGVIFTDVDRTTKNRLVHTAEPESEDPPVPHTMTV